MTLSAQAGLAQIDLHSHMIPDSYLAAVKAHGMEMDEGFPIPSWSTEEHLNFMDEAGIQTSVLTMPISTALSFKSSAILDIHISG